MATIDLFAPQSEDVIRAAMRRMKEAAKRRQRDLYELAIDYLENRQLEDVRGQIQMRYGQTQAGGAGQKIEPVTIPLTERYVAEAANLYNKPVKRILVDDEGVENEDATKELNDALADAGYNERLHRVEQIAVLLGTCGLWFQVKRGNIKPQIVVPQRIYPVVPLDCRFMDPADPDDYLGFVLELINDIEDSSSVSEQEFVLLTAAEAIFYKSSDPYEWSGNPEHFPNPFTWPQVADTEDGRGIEKDLPLQMLTFWHRHLPIGELLIDTDPEIVMLNRELNVQWSILLDTARTQGWSQMFMQLMNPDAPPARVAYGSRFALPLGVNESVGYVSAPNSYNELVELLKSSIKMIAVAKRMSPNDFSFDGQSPQSGFAKLIDSLPKLEAREERATRFKYLEEKVAWPRVASSLKYLGKMSTDISNLKLQVEYADVEFPRSVDEEVRRQEHEFKYGLSSPAIVMAKKLGITEEEAAEKIKDRKGQVSAGQGPAGVDGSQPPGQQVPGQPPQRQSLLGQLIRRPQREPIEPPEDA